jgi:YHS domain-containing protein
MLSNRFGQAFVAFASGLLLAGVANGGTVNTQDGVAIKGYDPVAYFTRHKPVPGDAKFQAMFEGATYRFASAADRALFLKHPAHYVPQYDGFCAYGAADGHKADIDPTAFTIVNDRLYLNYSKDVQKRWTADIPGYLAKADKDWPTVSQSTEVVR